MIGIFRKWQRKWIVLSRVLFNNLYHCDKRDTTVNFHKRTDYRSIVPTTLLTIYFSKLQQTTSKMDSFAKPHKKWTSWRRTLYCYFCDLTKVSHKRRCIQRYMKNKQFTVDFSSSILMNSRKCFTKGYT